MNDEDGFIVFMIFVGIAFFVGLKAASPNKQDHIDAFSKPICVEQKVGAEVVKKCYELKEVQGGE